MKPFRGLCATCSNSQICTFSREPSHPVLECDQFEPFSMTPPSSGSRRSPLARSWARFGGGPHYDYDGRLCGTCGIGRTCAVPESEKGSSDCKDYR